MKNYLLPLVCILFFAACKKDSNNNNTKTPAAKIAPDGFNYATAKNISVNLSLKAPNNDALGGVLVRFYNPADTSSKLSAIYTAVTDKNGKLTATISVPASVKSLIIDPQSFGILRYANATINGNAITATLGGTAGYSGDIVKPVVNLNSMGGAGNGNKTTNDLRRLSSLPSSIDFEYPSPYTTANAILNTTQYPTAAGRPAYMNAVKPLDGATISYVNSTLPEGSKLPNTHPQYFASGIVNTIDVVQKGTVVITFVTGIAGNANTLAYYTYPTNNPPTRVSDIKNATYIFPNASNYYSSPTLLQPGDNVTLGSFNAGTSIGFLLIANGWNSNGTISTSNTKWYSQDALNADGARHSIVAYDNLHNSYYIGFEDTNTTSSACDFDYNDCVFFATATPDDVINNSGVPPVTKAPDADGDGVPDAVDAFPNDPTRAYINYFPSQNSFAQIVFEDNWPVKGDYDLNDLVVNYRYTFVSNAQNQIVTMQGDYNVVAAGTVYKNGFGVQLPLAASTVQSVTGQHQISSYINFASNGVEAGQSKAVIIPFDNYNALISGSMINTTPGQPKATGTTASVLVTFTTPVDPTVLTPSALNPFIITKLTRGNEVHLPGYLPTDLANKTLFGTGDDATNLATGKTYVSTTNGPWAINFNSAFSYPTENNSILLGYLHFLDWAQSGGTSYTDWYSNTGAGYRNSSYIYVN